MKNKISAILIIHNEEKVIERCLKSIKEVADEILVAHDGKCSDNTLNIVKKYTNYIFIKPHRGRSAFHWIFLLRKAKNDWILKLDADEFLSDELKKNIPQLVKDDDADAYSFIWPWWNSKNEKYITAKWPRKISLYKKSKISGIGFPAWDTPIVHGKIIITNFLLEHRPLKGSVPNWKSFKEKALGVYCKSQAKYALEPLNKFDTFNYPKKDFPFSVRVRRRFPSLSSIPFSILAFFKTLFSEGAWREGKPVFTEAWTTAVYYLYLGHYIHLLKHGKNID